MWILKYSIGKFLHDIAIGRYFLNKVKKKTTAKKLYCFKLKTFCSLEDIISENESQRIEEDMYLFVKRHIQST